MADSSDFAAFPATAAMFAELAFLAEPLEERFVGRKWDRPRLGKSILGE